MGNESKGTKNTKAEEEREKTVRMRRKKMKSNEKWKK